MEAVLKRLITFPIAWFCSCGALFPPMSRRSANALAHRRRVRMSRGLLLLDLDGARDEVGRVLLRVTFTDAAEPSPSDDALLQLQLALELVLRLSFSFFCLR